MLLYPSSVPSATPIRDGFRVVLRQPSLIFAEISWRWSCGAAFWALAILSSFEYLHSLEVRPLTWLMWKSGVPPLMSQALADTIQGSGFKLLRIAAVLVPAYAVIWTFTSALGRSATLKAMLPLRTVRFRSILALSFLRAAITLAGILGLAGAFVIAARSYSYGHGMLPHPGRAFTILFVLCALVCYLWSILNWVLGLAPLLAAVRGDDALASVSAALDAFGRSKRAFAAINFAFGGLHLVASLGAMGVAFFSLGLASVVPGRVLLAILMLIALLYYALADWLYMARLGAYAALLDAEGLALPSLASAPSRPLPPEFSHSIPPRTAPEF